MKNRDAVLQNENLVKFFDWLLDRRFFPEYCGNPRRFLPKIDREIQHLKKLQTEGCSAITFAMENLEKARSLVAEMGNEFRSECMTLSVGASRKNVEQVWRLFAATCVAATLWPERSPHQVVWERLKSNGYTGSRNISERALEMSVRRFYDTGTPESRRFALGVEYQNFKMFSTSADTVAALRAGWHLKDRQRLCRVQTASEREIKKVEELCASYEARRDQMARTRRGLPVLRVP